ncbi:protein ABHD15 [Arapaima gigas]
MPLCALYRWGLLLYCNLQLSRYMTALSKVLDKGQLLCRSSPRDRELLTFCVGLTPSSTKADWDTYGEHNEPLPHADEVVVPVLRLGGWDDPFLPPIPTLHAGLLRSRPYFLPLLASGSGHCGGPSQACEEEGSRGEVTGEELKGRDRGASSSTHTLGTTFSGCNLLHPGAKRRDHGAQLQGAAGDRVVGREDGRSKEGKNGMRDEPGI